MLLLVLPERRALGIFDTPGVRLAERALLPGRRATCCVAIGLNIVVGQAGLLDLGYVAFFAIGAYTTGVLGSAHADLPWLVTVPIGVGVAMRPGSCSARPTLRLRGDYLAIVTLGFGEIVRITANNPDCLGGPRACRTSRKPPSVASGLHFGVLDAKPYYWLVLIVIVARDPRLQAASSTAGSAGRGLAIREDEDAAELMGVPTFKFKLWAFAIGAAIGGFGGHALRRLSRLHHARPVQPDAVDPVPRRRGARRLGQHRRRHPGRRA